MITLTFHSTQFDIIDRDGNAWLKSREIASALGYADEDSISRIYARRADEFTNAMTTTVKLTGVTGDKETRIFSLRGAHLLAMFARTKVAKEFRAWVLDILDREFAFKRGRNDVLSLEQADLLRNALTAHSARLPKDQQGPFLKKGWSKLKAHFKVSYRQIPQEQLTEALSMITRHAADWEVVDELPAVAAPALDGITKNNIEGLCSHMEFLHSWFKRVYPGLHALSPRLAAAAHDHFVDGVCFARNIVRCNGLKSNKEYAEKYPWDGGFTDRLEYNRSFT